MNCSIKSNTMLSLRIVLVAVMGLFVSVCFAKPAAPQVSIEIMVIDGADHVKISWEPVEGAESYSIFASTNPNLEDWGDSLATVGDRVFTYIVEDSVSELGRRYYFYVTAYAESNIPDWLILVNGRFQFNGTVTIDPFFISKYQVTQEVVNDVMGEWNFHFGGNPTHPAERVSWFDAVEYCNRLIFREGLTPAYNYLGRSNPDDWYDQWPNWNTVATNHLNVSCDWEVDGYRLPTEAEWNHAANASIHPAPFTYSGSNVVNEVAWYNGNAGGLTGFGTGQATNSYWDIETTGLETSTSGQGRMTRQMIPPYDDITYVDWDFENIWQHDIGGFSNNSYPALHYQHLVPPIDPPVLNVSKVTIENVEYMRLSWELVENALSYKLYATADIDAEEWGEPIRTLGENVTQSDVAVEDYEVRFFRMTASPAPLR